MSQESRVPDLQPEALQAAYALLSGGQAEAALAQFELFRDSRPDMAEGYLGCAEALLKMERVEEATTQLDHIRESVNRLASAHRIQLAGLYFRAHDFHAVVELLESCTHHCATVPAFYRYLSGAQLALGNRRESMETIRAGFHSFPSTDVILTQYLQCLIETGGFAEARERCARIQLLRTGSETLRRLHLAVRNTAFASALPPDIELVSVGQHCLPWTLFNRWGLRKSFWNPEKRTPFNQAIHTADAAARLVLNDFAGYLDPACLKIKRGVSGRPFVSNLKARVIFNHEDGRGWVKDDAANLRREYEFRIANFRRMVASSQCVFVCSVTSDCDLNLLADALQSRIGSRKQLYLFCIDHRAAPLPDLDHERAGIRYLRLPFPSDTYVWHQDFDSGEGFRFEKKIVDWVKEQLLFAFPETASRLPEDSLGERRMNGVLSWSAFPVLPAWMKWFTVDRIPDSSSADDCVELGGVAVLSANAPQGAHLFVQAGSGRIPVQWDIASPWVAQKYPDALNAGNARFKARLTSLECELELELPEGSVFRLGRFSKETPALSERTAIRFVSDLLLSAHTALSPPDVQPASASWIRHFSLAFARDDVFSPQKYLQMSGVLVVSDDAPADVRLLLRQRNRIVSVSWGQDSPWIGSRFDGVANSHKARFSLSLLSVAPTEHCELVLQSRDGEQIVGIVRPPRLVRVSEAHKKALRSLDSQIRACLLTDDAQHYESFKKSLDSIPVRQRSIDWYFTLIVLNCVFRKNHADTFSMVGKLRKLYSQLGQENAFNEFCAGLPGF